MAGTFDISKTRVCRDADADYLFGILFDYVKRMQGITQKAGETYKIYFGGVGSGNYFEFDNITKKLSLYLDNDLKGEWNA